MKLNMRTKLFPFYLTHDSIGTVKKGAGERAQTRALKSLSQSFMVLPTPEKLGHVPASGVLTGSLSPAAFRHILPCYIPFNSDPFQPNSKTVGIARVLGVFVG